MGTAKPTPLSLPVLAWLRNRRERVRGRVDPDQADVVVDVPAYDLGRDPVDIVELHVQVVGGPDGRIRAGIRDHVRVREDVALRRDHEARTLRLLGRIDSRAEDGEDGDDAGRALCVDLRRIEALADQRLRSRACRRRQRRRIGQSLGVDDDSLRLPADPTRAGRNPERRRATEDGGGERYGCGDWSTHRLTVAGDVPFPCEMAMSESDRRGYARVTA